MMVMLNKRYAPVDQLDRSSDYGSEGWGFEFSRAHQKKDICFGIFYYYWF